MLTNRKMNFASLALAGGLAIAFSGAASAQDWKRSGDPAWRDSFHHHRLMDRARNQLQNGAFYPRDRDYGYNYNGPGYNDYGYNSADRDYVYNNGYWNDGYYDNGPIGAAGAIVEAGLGAAGTAVTVATGYPYDGYGYDNSPYGYDPYQNNGWWGPTHNQYYNSW